MTVPDGNVTQLLASVSRGDRTASEELFAVLYRELHRLADSCMARERSDHTLSPTALIHEAYLKLVKSNSDDGRYENLGHFMATAAVVMRRILVNHAKARKTQKRGGGQRRDYFDELHASFSERSIDLIALDEALNRLRELDEKQHRLVELRFFGGLSMEQCAEVLDVSPRLAYYEWSHARAWLRSQLENHPNDG